MDYGTIAIKPIIKIQRTYLKIAKIAHIRRSLIFCKKFAAKPDSDVLHLFAARLLVMDGHPKYRRWNELSNYHLCFVSSWIETPDVIFNQNDDFSKNL